MSLFDFPRISSFLQSQSFRSDCVFAFNGSILAIGGQCSAPCVYDVATKSIWSLSTSASRSLTDSITAIAVSSTSDIVATGYPDGSIAVWNVRQKQNGQRLRNLHSKRIVNIGFLGTNNDKLVIVGADGLITSLSLVSSSLCAVSIETTIINLHNPILSFTSKSPNIFGFVGKSGFSLFRSDAKTEVLVRTESFAEGTLTCHCDSRGDTVRALVSFGKMVDVWTIVFQKTVTRESNVITFDCDVKCGFIFCFDYILVVLTNGDVKVLDMTRKIVYETKVEQWECEAEAQVWENRLLFFAYDKIGEHEIPKVK